MHVYLYLSSTTCLTQVFFKRGEAYRKLIMVILDTTKHT